MDSLEKTVLITGASRGIGKETAIEFAKAGYRVVINYNKSEENAKEVEKIIHNYGGKSLLIKADVSNEEEVEKMVSLVIKTFGRIDIVINNAGIAMDNDIYEKSKSEFMRVLEVNLVGTFLVSKEVSKYMEEGTIINISSTDGIDTYNDISMDYCASKAGVISLTKTLAKRFPNLHIYSLAPNWVETDSVLEMSPVFLSEELKRVGQEKLISPKQVANKLLELAKNEQPSGSIIRIDGGNNDNR